MPTIELEAAQQEQRTLSRLRRRASRTGWGYRICKGNAAHLHSNNCGRFQLVDTYRNTVVLGADYEARLDQISDMLDYLAEQHA